MFGWAYVLEQFVNHFGTTLAIIPSCLKTPLLTVSVAAFRGRASCVENALKKSCRNRRRVSSRRLKAVIEPLRDEGNRFPSSDCSKLRLANDSGNGPASG